MIPYAMESCEKMQKNEKNLPKLTNLEVGTKFDYLMLTGRSFLTIAGSIFGTCLMENLAVTLAGMTVLVPWSEKAPSMPWTETVG